MRLDKSTREVIEKLLEFHATDLPPNIAYKRYLKGINWADLALLHYSAAEFYGDTGFTKLTNEEYNTMLCFLLASGGEL